MKTAIVYYSKHHGNTKKLLDAIAGQHEVTLIDTIENPQADLSAYDRVGFASGIYYSKFHKSTLKLAEKLRKDQQVFFIYTCDAMKDGYTKGIGEAASRAGAKSIGEYGCLGFDTFGPFKLLGGIAKGHPDADELRGAVQFYAGLK